MKEERIMILKMIDEGKISVDDGVKLLKAINKSSDTEEKITNVAKQFKSKVSDMAKEAEPKVKKVAYDLKVKSSELADEISERIKTGMAKGKDTCDCEGDIIEADDMESYSFDYTDESDEDEVEDTQEVDEANNNDKSDKQ